MEHKVGVMWTCSNTFVQKDYKLESAILSKIIEWSVDNFRYYDYDDQSMTISCNSRCSTLTAIRWQ